MTEALTAIRDTDAPVGVSIGVLECGHQFCAVLDALSQTVGRKQERMNSQRQLILAVVIIAVGLVFLIGNVFDVDIWTVFWPTLLILLGLGLLLRPQIVSQDTAVRQKLIGDIRRDGVWQVTDEQFWVGVGDITLDMKDAKIPVGETRIRVWSFVSPVRMLVPPDIGVSVSSTAFVTDARIFERKRESILAPFHTVSDDYETAEKKIYLEVTSFVGDLRVRRV